VFLHGISSHAGWYARGNEELSAAGIEVHFLDRRGSGVDTQNRGDIDHWWTWIDDVATYLKQLRGVSADSVVLCGISWGGKLAAAVARRHPELVGGLGLICPGLYSPFEPGPVSRLALRMPLPRRMQCHRIAIPLRNPALFTDNPTWQAFIAEDASTLREITWRFAREDRTLTHYARQSAPFLKMPLLLMLAGRDQIIDNRRVVDFYERVPNGNKTIIEYPNAAHTLEFEPDPQPYFVELIGWLRAISSRFGAS
jgi:alpha-beta hydrolase superfamily lysophospholipase